MPTATPTRSVHCLIKIKTRTQTTCFSGIYPSTDSAWAHAFSQVGDNPAASIGVKVVA